MVLPDLRGRAQALVGVGRRHLDVDDRGVGTGQLDLAEERGGILCTKKIRRIVSEFGRFIPTPTIMRRAPLQQAGRGVGDSADRTVARTLGLSGYFL